MEFVYVVERYRLFDHAAPHGFVWGSETAPPGHPTLADYLGRIAEGGFFVERAYAERSPRLKQIIPYTLLRHGDQVFLFERLARGGEARLHGKLSVGIGGHINPPDDAHGRADLVESAARRELDEEVSIGSAYHLEALGVINDDSTEVGSVHFGVVYAARLEEARVVVREVDTLAGEFTGLPHAKELAAAEPDRLESWSRLVLLGDRDQPAGSV